ncbi:zinc finger protein 862-like [Patiria miniata]|uniref:HAT C-terminal dimerisation domain-containing protein n=1 Tax=Patiria miniata TaxID=46514 RepID=A0A914AGP6_PATMI|nr:zinc finger protein 862-like [Patiria miniata]
MAVDGLPLSTFKTLVRVQKANGVKLIEGTESSNKAREFVHEIANAIRAKLSSILCSSTAFSVLSDGSQARKTSSEKELVMVQVVKAGHSVFYVAALENIDSYGDANAENLHKSLDNALENKLKIPHDKYTKALVSATADGASVNTGIYNGLLVRFQKAERPWLVSIHCVSHRLELAVKDTLMKEGPFKQVSEMMTTLYYLMKQSGKFKRHFEVTASALHCQVYRFPKVHGTRFVGHQRKGLKILLHNWIPLAQAIENSIASKKHTNMDAKLNGILKKLRSLQFLAMCSLLYELLDIVSSLSLKFERGDVQTFEVLPAIDVTKVRLQDLLEDEDPVKKAGYSIEGNSVLCNLPKGGHMRKSAEKRETVSVELDGMSHAQRRSDTSTSSTTDESDMSRKLKQKVVPALMKKLDERFQSFSNTLFKNMFWVNPANWRSDAPETEIESLQACSNHFSTTLVASGFDSSKIKLEWQTLKIVHKSFYQGMEAGEMWAKVLQYRRKEFPNLCLLVELIMAIGVSNSTVECGFSMLTAMLSDRRLSLSHTTMEDLLVIKANHQVWSESERDDIIEASLKNFMSSKRRKRQVQNSTPNFATVEHGHSMPKKMKCSNVANSDTQDSDTQDSDTQDSDTQDSDTQDSDTQDSDTQDSDTLDSDTQDSDTQDSDTQDSDTQDSDTQDSDTQDSDTQDSDTQDSDTQDSDTQDSDTQDSDTQDSDTQDSDTQDSDTQDSDTQDSDTQDSDTDSSTSDSDLSGQTDLDNQSGTEHVSDDEPDHGGGPSRSVEQEDRGDKDFDDTDSDSSF